MWYYEPYIFKMDKNGKNIKKLRLGDSPVYARYLHICKGEEIPILLTFSAMVIPFSMLHVIDQAVNSGFINSLPSIIQVVLIATPITILAWKRDLLSAMGVHFIYDLVSMSILIK